MFLSEKFEEIKFSKSVAGYATKEVDGFIADILPLAKEEEQLILGLRAKLEALEARQDEIRKIEQEAYRLLEAAKTEAEIIVATAKKKAGDIESDTKVNCEVKLRSATSRASEIITNADAEAEEKIAKAKSEAERIVLEADANGRALIMRVTEVCNEENRKAKELSNECAAFEERFRTIVADTVKALAKMKEEAPVLCDTAVKVDISAKTPEPALEKDEEEPKTEKAIDVEFIGTKPVTALDKKEEKTQRRLYDTVQVTYENEEDFSEIQDIMKGPQCKSPTHFSE